MLRDFRQSVSDVEADICILGAGAAGITLARALASRPLDVLVVESGGLDYDPATQDLYKGTIAGRHYMELDVTRLRYFGGSTNHWAGFCTPMAEIDFRRRPWVPHSGWPIGRADLEPYYRQAQELCQAGPFEYDLTRSLPAGRGIHALDRGKITTRVWRMSPPTHFGEVYHPDLERSTRTTVLLHANAVEFEVDPTGRTVAALRLATLDGRTARARARRYVLAAGGIENPRLLLASNGVLPGGIGNGHDLVGRFFMDHPEIRVAAGLSIGDAETLDLYSGFTRDGIAMQPALCLAAPVQEAKACLSCGAGVGSVKAQQRRSGYLAAHDVYTSLKRGRLPDDLGQSVVDVLTGLDDLAVNTLRRLKGEHYRPRLAVGDVVTLEVMCEQAPNPDSRITLTGDRDALGMPRLALDWRLSEIDKRTMRVTAETIAGEFARLGFARLKLDDWLVADATTFPELVPGSHHHMGTTRMAEDPRHGVVDANLRVHGVDNLYVAGSSVFPTSSYAHPTLTIVALALRLADHLAR